MYSSRTTGLRRDARIRPRHCGGVAASTRLRRRPALRPAHHQPAEREDGSLKMQRRVPSCTADVAWHAASATLELLDDYRGTIGVIAPRSLVRAVRDALED